MTAEHWDRIYAGTPLPSTGWYEEDPAVSLDLVARCGLAPGDRVVDVGSGASFFIDRLLDLGFRDVVATDISQTALALLRDRLAADDVSRVRFIVDDVSRPGGLGDLDEVALWHDRAALHFLIEEAARTAYADTLRRVVRPGGFVILAAFAVGGATRCSGLPVRNHDASMLSELLGPGFRLLDTVDHVHVNPRGDPRPYVYARFERSPA